MLKNTLHAIPRLTPHMQELLMDCHERELMLKEPCDIGSTHYAAGLLSRGLLELKPFTTGTGKQIMAMYLTGLGRQYLNSM